MSGECDKCGEHTLDCTCGSFDQRRYIDRELLYDRFPREQPTEPIWIDVHVFDGNVETL